MVLVWNYYLRWAEGSVWFNLENFGMLTWGIHDCGSGWGGRASVPHACRTPPRRAGGRASESGRRESWPCYAGCSQPPPRSRCAQEAAGSSETARASGRGRRPQRCSDCCQRRSEAAGVMMSESRLRSLAGDLCRRAFPWKALEMRTAGVNKRAHRTREPYVTKCQVELA